MSDGVCGFVDFVFRHCLRRLCIGILLESNHLVNVVKNLLACDVNANSLCKDVVDEASCLFGVNEDAKLEDKQQRNDND